MKQWNKSQQPVISVWVYATTVMFLPAWKLFYAYITMVVVAYN